MRRQKSDPCSVFLLSFSKGSPVVPVFSPAPFQERLLSRPPEQNFDCSSTKGSSVHAGACQRFVVTSQKMHFGNPGAMATACPCRRSQQLQHCSRNSSAWQNSFACADVTLAEVLRIRRRATGTVQEVLSFFFPDFKRALLGTFLSSQRLQDHELVPRPPAV